MRVYVPEALQFGALRCERAGFYNLPDDVALAAMGSGEAFEATDDNKVFAFADGFSSADIVDLENGDSLHGLTTLPRDDDSIEPYGDEIEIEPERFPSLRDDEASEG